MTSERFSEVADRIFVARSPEWGVSIGVVAGDAGALVVDTRATAGQGQALRADVRRLTSSAEVRWVVNTHDCRAPAPDPACLWV